MKIQVSMIDEKQVTTRVLVEADSIKKALAKVHYNIQEGVYLKWKYDKISVLETVRSGGLIEHGIDYYRNGRIYQYYTRFYYVNYSDIFYWLNIYKSFTEGEIQDKDMEYLVKYVKNGRVVRTEVITANSVHIALGIAHWNLESMYCGTEDYENISIIESVTNDVTIEHGIDYRPDGSIYQWYTRFFSGENYSQYGTYPRPEREE